MTVITRAIGTVMTITITIGCYDYYYYYGGL